MAKTASSLTATTSSRLAAARPSAPHQSGAHTLAMLRERGLTAPLATQNFASGKCPYGRRCSCQAIAACDDLSPATAKRRRCNFIHELPTPPFGPSAACLPSPQQLLNPQLLSPQQLGPASPTAALLLYSYFYPAMPTELPTLGRAPMPMPPSSMPPMPPMSPAAPPFTPTMPTELPTLDRAPSMPPSPMPSRCPSMPPMSPAAPPFTPKPRAPPSMVKRSRGSARDRLLRLLRTRLWARLNAPKGPLSGQPHLPRAGARELAASEVAKSTAFEHPGLRCHLCHIPRRHLRQRPRAPQTPSRSSSSITPRSRL
eukprot:scaffold29147_cov63-Phaeocystis_antarctica.AAC.3